MTPALPVDSFLSHQAQVRFMNQFGRLDALARLLSAHVVGCQTQEFAVHDGEQAGSRLAVAASDFSQ